MKMKLLTVKEVAEILRVKPSTVYQWVELGKIPFFKLNGSIRFSEDGVLKWLENQMKSSESSYNTLAGRRPVKGGKN